MRLLLATSVAATLLAAGPVVAAPNVHSPCKAPAGAHVVKPGTPLTLTPTTPVGVLGDIVSDSAEPVGDFYVDLGGKPVAATSTLELTLSWLNPVSDYDLVVNGNNELSSDNPEVFSLRGGHCKKVVVAVDVFLGVPVDELTLVAKATQR